MKIVVNTRFLTQSITGVQRFSIEISRELKKIYGSHIKFVSPYNISHPALAEELEVEIIGKNKGVIWEQFDLPKYLKRHNNPLLLNLANTAPILYSNQIVTLHDIAYERFPQTFDWKFKALYRFMIPKILKNSKHILTVSQFSKKEITGFYNIDENNISVVYNSINSQFRSISKNNKEKYILAVSSINYRKNFVRLIKAFNKLENQKTKLYLVGGIDKYFTDIEISQDIESNPDIEFKGRIDDIELIQLYSNALFFIYPSLYEGFGIPPIEAQACGCPVIVSNVASLSEVCGDSVLYCNPYDIDDIKAKMELLLNSENLRQELISKGFENIKRFGWQKSAKQIGEILEKYL